MMGTTEVIRWSSIGLNPANQTVTIQLQEWDAGQSNWVLHTTIATGVPSPNGDSTFAGQPAPKWHYDWAIPILLDPADIDSARIRIVGDNVIEEAGDLEGFSWPFDIVTNPTPVSGNPGSAVRESNK